jgi:hypothetical protein
MVVVNTSPHTATSMERDRRTSRHRVAGGEIPSGCSAVPCRAAVSDGARF